MDIAKDTRISRVSLRLYLSGDVGVITECVIARYITVITFNKLVRNVS